MGLLAEESTGLLSHIDSLLQAGVASTIILGLLLLAWKFLPTLIAAVTSAATALTKIADNVSSLNDTNQELVAELRQGHKETADRLDKIEDGIEELQRAYKGRA